MKTLKAVLAVLAALAATLAGLDVSGFIALMPPDVAKVLVIVPSAAAVAVHLLSAFQKNLDGSRDKEDVDGTGGGRLRCHPLAVILALALAFLPLLLSSCATVESETTVTAPDGTVTVTKSKSTAPDAGSVNALAGTAAAFAPRAVVINDNGK